MANASLSPFRVVITGGGGFVGRHLTADLLRHLPKGSVVFACSREGKTTLPGTQSLALDMTNTANVAAVMADVRPSHVVHLAAISSLGEADQSPGLAWRINVTGTLTLGEALSRVCPGAQLLAVSSSEIYGGSVSNNMPVTEDTPLAPLNVYACTKAAADLLVMQFVERGLAVVRARPFNHIGPGQSERFATANFAIQVARIERGLQEPVIRVGNLDAQRDFLDVRDVAAAYRAILLGRAALEPGIVFNIASGQAHRVREVLDGLLALSDQKIAVESDPQRLRPGETPLVVGDASRLRNRVGWTPRYTWEQTLQDVLEDARVRVATVIDRPNGATHVRP